tara:strand:- start:1070 stop:1360 length:291 start_codon:yes stop_codon:yes gene_type:complete
VVSLFCNSLKINDKVGGAEGNRTPDLRIANATLSHLSYGPTYFAKLFEGADNVAQPLICQGPWLSQLIIFSAFFDVAGRPFQYPFLWGLASEARCR